MCRQDLFLLPFHFLVQHLMSVNKLRVQRSEERNDEKKPLKRIQKTKACDINLNKHNCTHCGGFQKQRLVDARNELK